MMAADDGSEDIMNIILKTKDIDVKMGDCVSLSIERFS